MAHSKLCLKTKCTSKLSKGKPPETECTLRIKEATYQAQGKVNWVCYTAERILGID